MSKDYFKFLKSGRGRKKRNHYQPFYDDFQDYNTNAKSYYDYLARFNKLLHYMSDLINRLLRRDIEVHDTNSVQFIKTGDWLDDDNDEFDDVIELKANVILSDEVLTFNFSKIGSMYSTSSNNSYQSSNSLSIFDDGLYSPDYKNVLDAINGELIKVENKDNAQDDRLDNIELDISQLKDDITDINNEITDIKSDINNHENRITSLENVDWQDILNRLETLESYDFDDWLNRLNSLETTVNNLEIPQVPTQQINDIESALTRLLQNLNDSGAINNATLDFNFNSNRNIATGNINIFGGATDGDSYIRTNNGESENDLASGV